MKAVMITALVAAAATSSAHAQALPACSGKYETIRTDAIKPGMMTLFRKAVEDHQAWYTGHGLSDRILMAQVVVRDSQSDGPGFSPTTVLTIHTDMSNPGAPAAHASDDAAWNAYVSEYQQSSDVVNAATVCVTGSLK